MAEVGNAAGAAGGASDGTKRTNGTDVLGAPPERAAGRETAGPLERGGLPRLCVPQTVPDPTAGATPPRAMYTALIRCEV